MKATHTKLHARLAKELESLIPSLDEEGLAFLVEQANVHIRNMEIDKLNAEIEADEAAAGADVVAGAGIGAGKAGKRPRGAKAGEGERRADFRIERSPSGSSYHVISGGKWKMFSESEMLSMVNIASSDGTSREVAGRLHAWMEAERPDAFADLDIDGANDPKMAELVALLRAKFKVRKR